jgi:hypothetical protein
MKEITGDLKNKRVGDTEICFEIATASLWEASQ